MILEGGSNDFHFYSRLPPIEEWTDTYIAFIAEVRQHVVLTAVALP